MCEGGGSQGLVPPCELVEELLVERVTLFATARRHEDIAADELMDNLAVSRHAAKGYVDVPIKLNGHLSGGMHTHDNIGNLVENQKVALG